MTWSFIHIVGLICVFISRVYVYVPGYMYMGTNQLVSAIHPQGGKMEG